MWFYITYAHEERGFLGAVFIEAETPDGAIKRGWDLGLQPYGHIQAILCSVPDEMMRTKVPPELRETLLTEWEVREYFEGKSLKELSDMDRDR